MMAPDLASVRDEALTGSREQLIRVTARVVAFVWIPLVALGLIHRAQEPGPLEGRLLISYVTVLVLAASLAAILWRPSYRRAAWQAFAFLGVMGAVLGLAIIMDAMQVNAVSIAFVVVAWSSLFFGARGMWGSVGALALIVLGSAVWHLMGLAPAPPATSPSSPDYWGRLGGFFIVGLLLCGLIVRVAVRAYEGALQRERDALRRQADAQAARIAAELQAEVLQRRQLTAALAAGMAHDINNLLTITSVSAELLSESARTAEERDAVDQMVEAGQRASRLVRDLLAYGRIVPALNVPFPVSRAIERLSFMLRGIVPDTVRAHFRSDTTATLAGDELRFEQVVINLAKNAVEAMPEGGALEVQVADADAEFCEVVVRDTGHGMTDAVRARLFEPFFTTKSHGEGSGVGLSMVKRIVDDVGGDVAVESAEGLGTTFRIRWPRAEAPPAA